MKKTFPIIAAALLALPIKSFAVSRIEALTGANIDEGSDNTSVSQNSQFAMEHIHEHSIGLGIGQTSLIGDIADSGENQITWDVLYNYSASPTFSALVNFHHSKHKYKSQYSQLTTMAFGVKGKFYDFDAFSPYGVAGLGFYLPRVLRPVNGQLVESRAKLALGVHLGLGVDLRVNKFFTAGILAHYHNPFDVKQEVGPDVDGSYVKLMVTGAYTFALPF
jgi:hypothetical protein